MKRFVFTEMLLMSGREHKARRVRFDPRLTVIKGTNETGKSCLMKSIYLTFGAASPLIPARWKDADPRSAMKFEVDGEGFRILKDGGNYTLFDSRDKKIQTFTSVTKGLAPCFAKLFGFHLRLQLRDGGESQATPAFLFLPFYIDQDKSWVTQWASFERLKQFGNTHLQDMVEYHTGVRPNDYYTAKSALVAARSELKPLEERRAILDKVLQDLENKLQHVSFDVSLEQYGKEIERLLVQCDQLQGQEDELKRELVALHNRRIALTSQAAIARRAAGELAKDYEYAVADAQHEIECPICGAMYENSFQERFAVADDEDKCRELIIDIDEEVAEVDGKIGLLQKQYTTKSSERAKLGEILQAKQGKVTLQELLENEGQKEARRLLQKQVAEISRQVGEVDARIRSAQDRMKKATNVERKKEIMAEYQSCLRKYLFALDVHDMPPSIYKRVDAKMPGTGSARPRALLAYYFSILQTINKFSTSTVCPIVIDSPKQQDPDDVNWRSILTLIRDEQPKDTQMVVALVEEGDIKLPGTAVELTEKRSLMLESEYDSVAAEMRPLLDASMRD